MIADIYIRVSTKAQVKGHGLVRQHQVCSDWCKQNNTTIRNVIKDVCSAYRPQHLAESKNPLYGNLGRYLKTFKDDPPDFFVFEHWDRLDRSLNGLAIVNELQSVKTKVVSVW